MTDWILGMNTDVVLKTVLTLSGEQFELARGLLEAAPQLKKELQNLENKLQENQAMLSDAQTKQESNKSVQLWVKNLQSVSLDAQIVLDEFEYEFLQQKIKNRKRDKVRSLIKHYSPFSSRSKLAQQMKDVLSSLEDLYKQSNSLGLRPIERTNSQELESSFSKVKIRAAHPSVAADDQHNPCPVVGRDGDVAKVIDLLTAGETQYSAGTLPVIAILGTGGIGKSTLAGLVYNHEKVKSHFDARLWVCCTHHDPSDKSFVKRFLNEMLQSFTKDTDTILGQGASNKDLVKELHQHLKYKSYLLVLDNVWKGKADEWDQLKTTLLEIGGSKESRILATTQSGDIALATGMSGFHRLPQLSQDHSRELFEKSAFAQGGPTRTAQLVEVGERILKRCGGVPLVIKTIGCLLFTMHSELDWLRIETSETWSGFHGEESQVLSAIKLTYDHLPSVSLKQCFSYCAIFEKDAVFEKEELVQLWMAQGLLSAPQKSHLQMEDIGNSYLSVLFRSALLENAGQYLVGNTTPMCRMHDLVYDVSLKVSENYCCHITDAEDRSNRGVEATHISISSDDTKIWKSLKCVFLSKLRTLHLKGLNLSEEILENFKYLYVLVVDQLDATKLPDTIGDVKQLRFLDISRTNITSLPKSFKKLYCLQTLRVGFLREAPKGFGDLMKLRHFHMKENRQKTFFPGLGQLKDLQTLPYFNVGQSEGYQIKELGSLDNLRGRLAIFGLQNVEGYEGASESKLSNKSQVKAFELHWDKKREDRDDSEVMEGLRPHPDLESLMIEGYQSPNFPSWMVSENDTTLLLRKIVKLTLQKLDKCEQLPSLGELPFLEQLHLHSLRKVKSIGKEFYGWSNLDASNGNSSKGITVFAALRRLELSEMHGLEEWYDAIESVPSSSSSSRVNDAFPHLKEMCIFDLPKLIAFPNLGKLPCLEILNVKGCKAHPKNVEA